jgi:hypothetical protein
MNEDLKRRIGRDFLTDPARSAEAHRAALWSLLQSLERLTDATELAGLSEAVESCLELLELHDHEYHNPGY